MQATFELFLGDITLPLYALFALVVLIILWIVQMEIRMRRLMRGKHSKDLEGTIHALQDGQIELHSYRQELERYLKGVEERLRRSLQGVHTVRFNPFKGTGSGGNQSFATAFVNEKGDGVVFSSLYARDHVSVFAKPVIAGISEFELSAEEKETLKTASAKLTPTQGSLK